MRLPHTKRSAIVSISSDGCFLHIDTKNQQYQLIPRLHRENQNVVMCRSHQDVHYYNGGASYMDEVPWLAELEDVRTVASELELRWLPGRLSETATADYVRRTGDVIDVKNTPFTKNYRGEQVGLTFWLYCDTAVSTYPIIIQGPFLRVFQAKNGSSELISRPYMIQKHKTLQRVFLHSDLWVAELRCCTADELAEMLTPEEPYDKKPLVVACYSRAADIVTSDGNTEAGVLFTDTASKSDLVDNIFMPKVQNGGLLSSLVTPENVTAVMTMLGAVAVKKPAEQDDRKKKPPKVVVIPDAVEVAPSPEVPIASESLTTGFTKQELDLLGW